MYTHTHTHTHTCVYVYHKVIKQRIPGVASGVGEQDVYQTFLEILQRYKDKCASLHLVKTQVSIRQHTSAYVIIRQYTSAYLCCYKDKCASLHLVKTQVC